MYRSGRNFRYRIFSTLLFAAVLLQDTHAALLHAGPYPERPVKIILPYGAGGIADVTQRLIAQKLSENLGQQFVIENRPGAAGIVGINAVVASAPDGYTLAMIGGGLTVAKSLFKSLPYDLERDLIPISTTAFFGLIVATKAGSPFRSAMDVIAAAKATPGKLNFGAINPGSTQHLAGELFKSSAGISVTTIPFKTTPELVTALIRGDIDIVFEYQAALQGALDDRQIVALASTGRERSVSLPNVPTVAESGLADYEVTTWNGLAAPLATPADVIAVLNRSVNEVLKLPEVIAATAKFGMESRGSSVEELHQRIERDVAKWAAVIDAARIEKK
jgi:tripartite-type tricarboxylate transporter receptor subunit TctC